MLRTNSSKETFEEGLLKLKQRLIARGYPENIIGRSLPEVNFAFRQSALTHIQKRKGHERLVRFVTTYHPAVKNLKQILILRSSLTKKEDPLKTRW